MRLSSTVDTLCYRQQQQLITAHEDQLAEITNLCKHEMQLLKGVKMGDQVPFRILLFAFASVSVSVATSGI